MDEEDIFEGQGRSCFSSKGVTNHPEEHIEKRILSGTKDVVYNHCKNCQTNFFANGEKYGE